MASLGIDFGSSYTTVSWVNPRYGKPEIVKFNGDGSVKYPSVIMGTESGLVLGYDALSILEEINKLSLDDRLENLANFIPSIKRTLDVNAIEFIGGKSYTHLELLTCFFHNIRSLAVAHCGSEYSFDSVTFSHPVEFENAKIALIEQALRKAGFEKVCRDLEPVAAVLGYGLDHVISEKEGILVFDFGGGTIDVAFVQKNASLIKQLCAPRGNSMCGGQDIDLLIYEDLRKRILAEYGLDITVNNCVDYTLLNSCRRLKEYFSGSNDSYTTSIALVNEGRVITYKYKLSREAFNNIIYSKVNEAVNVARIVINEVMQKQYIINKVLLIGGSSQLTLVKELLSSCLKDCVIDTCGEKDIAVALGNVSNECKHVKEHTDDKPVADEPSLNREKSMKCPVCGSEKCYKNIGKFGYHCIECDWEGANVKVIF